MFQRSDFKKKKKGFVYIKIDVTGINTVPYITLQNLLCL